MCDTSLRTIQFKCGYWSFEDDEDKGCIIHLSGLTKTQETVQIQIEGFTPFVYLELPKRIKWNEYKCKSVFDHFKKSMGSQGPIKYKMYSKDKLHYKKSINTMFMTFSNNKNCRDFGNKCTRYKNVYIIGVGTIYNGDFIVHEQNIDPILKFTAAKKISLAGWVETIETFQPDEENLSVEERIFSSANIDFYTRFNCIKPCIMKEEINVQPTYCSFDGEMYSKNHNAKLSDPKIKENKVFQISMIFGRLYDKLRECYLLTLFDPLDIKGVIIIRCKTEKELLLKFSSLIREKDPDIFIGYNIMKFDWNYLIKRAKYAGILDRFMKISRISGKKANIMKPAWASSAYGEQKFRYPDCHGRINLDVMIEVERNYRMPIYTLNAVSEKFLSEHKDPISARQMFMIYQITEEILPLVNTHNKITKFKLYKIKQRVKEILLNRFTKGIVRNLRNRILASNINTIKDLIREGMQLIGKYCVKDSILPIDLVEKLNLYTTMEQMSNVMHVPMSYLHTRGQQIKVLAQVYRETIYNNIIIPYKNKKEDLSDEKYQGAIVIEANPGDYDDVGMLDFASLYPSMIITYNICYITILEDNDPTPDEACHVLIWSDHVACFKGDTKITVAGDHSILIKDLEKYRGYVQALDKDCIGTKNYTQTNFFNKGLKKCIRLTLEDGSILECTSDHRIRTENNEWIEAKDLILNQTRILSGYTPPVFDMENEELNICGKMFFGIEVYKFTKLLGLIYSNACVIDTYINIYSKCYIDVDNIVSDIIDLTGNKPIVEKQKYGWNIIIYGYLVKIIKDIFGITKENNQNHLKILPEFLEKSSVNIIRSFLSGLFGGDGNVFSFLTESQNIGTIKLIQTSNNIEYLVPIFDKLQIYLGKCGINSVISQFGNERNINIINSDCIKFKEIIGFSYCCYKSIRLEAGCKYLQFVKNVKSCITPIDYMESIGVKDLFILNNFDINLNSLPLFKLKIINIEEIGIHEVFDIEVNDSHSFLANGVVVHNCEHDPQKRKRKKADIMCCDQKYRFRKVKIEYNEKTGEITRKYEGLMPRLERNLLASRSIVKEEMFKIGAILQMQKGLASEKDLEYYKKIGLEIIEKGSLGKNKETMLGVTYNALNAKQLAIKCAANSAYGAMGAKTGFIPFIAGAASVTAMGRKLITMAIDKIKDTWNNCKLVYGDTDSCMIKFMGCTLAESFELCEIASKMTTHYLKCCVLNLVEEYFITTETGIDYTLDKINSKHKDFINLSYNNKILVIEYESIPIDLEFESMFGRLLLLTKKRYIAHTINKNGKIIDKVNKGVVLARRDNSNYLRTAYKKLTDYILLNPLDEQQLMDLLYEEVNNLFTRKVPDTNLIIYMGVKNVMSYAKKKEIIKKTDYGTTTVTYYLDSDKNIIVDPIGPTDPRLEYRNLPQCLLSLKMLRRGVDIPPNTRLEFLYLENPDVVHQGHKAEDYTYYIENKKQDCLKPDKLHYIEKQLSKPVTELLSVKYPKETVVYEKLEICLNRLLRHPKLSDLKKNRLAKINKFDKTPTIIDNVLDNVLIGWEVFEELCFSSVYSKRIKELDEYKLSKERQIIYKFKGLDAKVDFVLTSSNQKGMNDFNVNKDPDRELIHICKIWKSRSILDKLCKQYGVKKRSHKHPTQTGNKLRKNTKVILIQDFEGQNAGSYAKIIDFIEIEDGKNKIYYYDLLMNGRNEIIIYKVPRNTIATYYLKDSSVMKDIFISRTNYKKVVDHIQILSNSLIFIE